MGVGYVPRHHSVNTRFYPPPPLGRYRSLLQVQPFVYQGMQIHHATRLMREVCALRHLSINTEKSYTHWLSATAFFLRTPCHEGNVQRAVKEGESADVTWMGLRPTTCAMLIRNWPWRGSEGGSGVMNWCRGALALLEAPKCTRAAKPLMERVVCWRSRAASASLRGRRLLPGYPAPVLNSQKQIRGPCYG